MSEVVWLNGYSPGCTGRAGRQGQAIMFFTEDDAINMHRYCTLFHPPTVCIMQFTQVLQANDI